MPTETTGGTTPTTGTTNNKNWTWAVILASGMMGSALIMSMCGRGCTKEPGCTNCKEPTKQDTVWVVKEPSVKVDGDAIIIHGNDNNATLIKGDGNNAATSSRNSGNQNVGSKPAPEKPKTSKPVKQNNAPVTPAPTNVNNNTVNVNINVPEQKPADKQPDAPTATVTVIYEEVRRCSPCCRPTPTHSR